MITRITTLLASALLLAVSSTAPSTAAAQVRAGVDASAIVPEGYSLVSVTAPDELALPVRVVIAPDARPSERVLVHVRVLESEAAARAFFADRAEWRTSHSAMPRTDVGEVAWGTAATGASGMVAFARDNVVVEVLITGEDAQCDAMPIALHVDRAIAAAPVGSTRSELAAPVPQLSREVGSSARITMPAGAIAMDVRVSGDAVARRVGDAWLVSVTGEGAWEVSVAIVDAHLRSANASVRWAEGIRR